VTVRRGASHEQGAKTYYDGRLRGRYSSRWLFDIGKVIRADERLFQEFGGRSSTKRKHGAPGRTCESRRFCQMTGGEEEGKYRRKPMGKGRHSLSACQPTHRGRPIRRRCCAGASRGRAIKTGQRLADHGHRDDQDRCEVMARILSARGCALEPTTAGPGGIANWRAK